MIVYMGFLANAFYPVMRVSSFELNVGLFALVGVMPWLAAWLFMRRSRGRTRLVALCCCLPLLGISAIGTPIALVLTVARVISPGAAPYIEQLSEIDYLGSRVIVEQKSYAGIMIDDAVNVYQERIILPGVKLVRRFGSYSPASAADVAEIADGVIRVEVWPFTGAPRPLATDTFTVKRYVYF
jgi:hypothetical protein